MPLGLKYSVKWMCLGPELGTQIGTKTGGVYVLKWVVVGSHGSGFWGLKWVVSDCILFHIFRLK